MGCLRLPHVYLLHFMGACSCGGERRGRASLPSLAHSCDGGGDGGTTGAAWRSARGAPAGVGRACTKARRRRPVDADVRAVATGGRVGGAPLRAACAPLAQCHRGVTGWSCRVARPTTLPRRPATNFPFITVYFLCAVFMREHVATGGAATRVWPDQTKLITWVSLY